MNPKRLRTTFRYEPELGRLIHCRTGREITGPYRRKNLKSEYESLVFEGKHLVASRVIWALITNEWPARGMVVDHINGDTHDNRLSNLRLITNAENVRNSTKARSGKLKPPRQAYRDVAYLFEI